MAERAVLQSLFFVGTLWYELEKVHTYITINMQRIQKLDLLFLKKSWWRVHQSRPLNCNKACKTINNFTSCMQGFFLHSDFLLSEYHPLVTWKKANYLDSMLCKLENIMLIEIAWPLGNLLRLSRIKNVPVKKWLSLDVYLDIKLVNLRGHT